MAPFIVFSLPRSRSAWLSVLLSASGGPIGHDIGIECDTPEDFIRELGTRGGTCETGLSFAWQQIKENVLNVRFAVVLRDPEEVIQSLVKFNIVGYDEEIYQRHSELLEIAKQPDVFVCNYDDLVDNSVVANLYEFCTRQKAYEPWIAKLQDSNIQIDVQKRMARLYERSNSIENLKKLKLDYVFQIENWSTELSNEVKTLSDQHFDETISEIIPQRKFDLDSDLMYLLDRSGFILTVRKRNQLIGYITWQIVPDVESKGLLIGEQGAWYAIPGHSRAAIKLFDKSINELKVRGVKCVFPHHAVIGRGRNIGKFLLKRGATLIQHKYSLWIGE